MTRFFFFLTMTICSLSYANVLIIYSNLDAKKTVLLHLDASDNDTIADMKGKALKQLALPFVKASDVNLISAGMIQDDKLTMKEISAGGPLPLMALFYKTSVSPGAEASEFHIIDAAIDKQRNFRAGDVVVVVLDNLKPIYGKVTDQSRVQPADQARSLEVEIGKGKFHIFSKDHQWQIIGKIPNLRAD